MNSRDHRKIVVVDGKNAFTGGFNLQIAFSTGALAGRSAARWEKEETCF